ncbi:MAG: diguanylate cyclase [Oscillospiraceae bacterium]|nr:diguanylate cyclase [Oscillospiraceae bacterium]
MMKWIAVVDDDVQNLNVAGTILSRNHMRVTAMKSGAQLLTFVRENRPDLILLDIAMPEMDGFETLSRLRALEKEMDLPEIPVVFLTASEENETETKGFESGVSDYIRKPFYPDVLLKRISNIIDHQERMMRFEEEATTDKLTGLLNKVSASERLSAACSSRTGCLMMIDLDSFKLVNDIYGHETGDRVLIAFSDLIRSTLPPKSICGRMGGDEFAAFAEITDSSAISDITAALNTELTKAAKQLMGEDMEIPLGASVGAVFVPESGTVYTELFKLADKALYSVKQNGKHGCAVYRHDDMKDEESGDRPDMATISKILEERNIPDKALRLEKEQFTAAYRFVARYMMSYNRSACKLLFTITPREGADADDVMNAVGNFGEHLAASLRKSDLMMHNRRDQYFVLLPEASEGFGAKVADTVISSFTDSSSPVDISAEYELLSPGENDISDRRSRT